MKWSASFVFLLASGLPAQSTPCKSTVVGDLRVQTFQSKTFGDILTLRIWLPPGYYPCRHPVSLPAGPGTLNSLYRDCGGSIRYGSS
jgi:hypothetical protein